MDSMSLAHADFNAAEGHDQRAFLACFTPDATVWHNFSCSEEYAPREEIQLTAMPQAYTSLKYKYRRYVALPDGAVLQHVSRGTLSDVGEP